MARGWENKSVESMMDDHDNRPKERQPERTAEEMALEQKHASLALSRTGVLNDLAQATHPRLTRWSCHLERKTGRDER
jgi:hypothetical protein